MRAARSAIFAVAAAAVALGSGGLVVVPHHDSAAPGPGHEHPVTAYRFPLALFGDAPGVPRAAELAHHVPAVHLAHLRALLGIPGSSAEPVQPLAELAAAAVLALLVMALPRLPRPTRRPVWDIPVPTVLTPQWRSLLGSPPPRGRVFVSA